MARTVYHKNLGRGVCYDFHDKDGSGTYTRLPVWELLVLCLLAILISPLFILCLLLRIGK